ncbi:MAG: helicase HerA domain-containing protein [Thermoproteus sp.]
MSPYGRSLLLFLSSLALIAAAASAWPPLGALSAVPVLVWGEDVVLWLYTRARPVEPVRVPYGDGFQAAYDPAHRLYHWLWDAEPVQSVLGVEAAARLHELYSKLSLGPGESIAFVALGDWKLVRFTSRRYDPARVGQIEAALREFYVLARRRPWLSSPKPVAPWPYLAALAFLPMALLASGWALLGAAAWLWAVKRFRSRYREPAIPLSFSHMSKASALPASRDMLETMASAEAAAFADMERWAVAFADRPPEEVYKKFVKTYEGRDTGRRLIRIRELSEFVERMAKYNERPVLLYVYGSRDLHSLSLSRDWLAAADFWILRSGVRALSHDLARFPLLYGGRTLPVGRELVLGLDRFGRPVSIDVDALPSAHAVFIGGTGSGKSWTVATWALRLAELGVDLVVLDPHGDYRELARLVGARVVEVPAELPRGLAGLSRSKELRAVLREFGVEPVERGGEIDVERTLSQIRPFRWVDVDRRHVVYAMDSIAGDEDLLAFYLSLLLVYHYAAHAGRRHERLKTAVIVDEARLLGSGGESYALRKLASLALGGRKWGFAVWLVAQSHDDLPRRVLRSASFVLIYSGNYIYLSDAAADLRLAREDQVYLQSSTTPAEAAASSGQPYAMGVLVVGQRGLKYHVKIPLDARLKPRM